MWFQRSKLLRPRIESVHFAGVAWLVFVSCLPTPGQTVSVELRTKTGRSQFHVGEVILLDLIFVANAPNTYEVNGDVALPEPYPLRDVLLMEPEKGWADPLDDYRKALFKAMSNGHLPINGGLAGFPIRIGAEPVVLSLILNDYVRFSHPGRYTIQVQDSRVTPISTQLFARPDRLILTSNPLDLIIVPADAEWQQNRLHEDLDSLAKLRAVIDSAARSYDGRLADSCINLRALGTREAGATMVDALRNEDLFSRCSFQVGILEYPDRKFILERMRDRFKDTDFPVTYTFFNTMAMISLLAEGHPDQLFGPNQEKIDRRLEQQLLSVVSLKRGEAKTKTISTLVNMCFAAYGGDMGEFAHVPREPSRLNTRVLQVATAYFEQLSPGVQSMLRNYRKAHGLETTGR